MTQHVVAVTGCLGFFGKHLCRTLLQQGHVVYGLDAETYAADLRARGSLAAFRGDFIYARQRVEDLTHLPDVDVVFHLAAETHVDNSLTDAGVFLRTNVLGTYRMLEVLRGKRASKAPLLIHVSTDEVFGPSDTPKRPYDAFNPRNPYAASKAAAEHLVAAYASTYDLRCRIVRPTNLYGTGQYPEKLIPRAVRRISRGLSVPIHGDGSARRSWLEVGDAVDGLLTVWQYGRDGEAYHLGGNTTTDVRTIVQAIGDALGRDPQTAFTGPNPIGEFEYQRPGLDVSYQLDDLSTRVLGWLPRGVLFDELPVLVAALRDEPYR